MLLRNNGNIYLILYLVIAFFFGFFYDSKNVILDPIVTPERYMRFIIRALFGLGYLILALVYCRLSNKPMHARILMQLYLLFELLILIVGFLRYFIWDNQVLMTMYFTLFSLTVSPLGLLFTHVIVSLKQKKPIVAI